MKRQVRVGALDGEAVAAVLNAAGHRVALIRRQMTADLTSREIDVLRLVGRGLSAKQIARELGISPKTADNHTQNIYAKIGVSTRPAAALFAIEHGLLTVGEQNRESSSGGCCGTCVMWNPSLMEVSMQGTVRSCSSPAGSALGRLCQLTASEIAKRGAAGGFGA